ncbi:conjugal transfer relaxosome DNA-binding protein TraM [uncultured Cedecea sp.]|uniref:conjugal transfer relaxosome DNA-binding protein TraM n=1 Tax=uncultured Cedecea sp. TaxID=988762 RepID=UPI002605FE45|nr:conjugal transfer relaxosome DNA-binding protein TraM [uncultured Cedecea sp.]
MAKVQAYVSNETTERIDTIVAKRRAEGAREKDVSHSSVVSMLIELGLRVYETQMERKETGFNQMDFNMALFESVIKTQFTVNKVLGIGCLSPHVDGMPKWEWSSLVSNIKEDVREVMNQTFPHLEDSGD